MKKTINELNAKTWYRLTKVLFIFFFSIITIFVAIITYYSISSADEYKITRPSLIEVGESIYLNDISNAWSSKNPSPTVSFTKDSDGKIVTTEEYNIWKASSEQYVNQKLATINDDEFYRVGLEAYNNDYENIRNSVMGSGDYFAENIADLRIERMKNMEKFVSQPKYSTTQNIISTLGSVVAMIIIFIIIKRIFYYIAIGIFFPKKENK